MNLETRFSNARKASDFMTRFLNLPKVCQPGTFWRCSNARSGNWNFVLQKEKVQVGSQIVRRSSNAKHFFPKVQNQIRANSKIKKVLPFAVGELFFHQLSLHCDLMNGTPAGKI